MWTFAAGLCSIAIERIKTCLPLSLHLNTQALAVGFTLGEMKKALCIGVGYTSHVGLDGESLQLDGSHGDAMSMARLLERELSVACYTIT